MGSVHKNGMDVSKHHSNKNNNAKSCEGEENDRESRDVDEERGERIQFALRRK